MTLAGDHSSHPRRVKRIGVRGTVRAIARLARSRRRLAHLPTVMQVRTMSYFDGHEPCSYLLDPAVNFVPDSRSGVRTRSAARRCASPVAIRRAGGRSSW